MIGEAGAGVVGGGERKVEEGKNVQSCMLGHLHISPLQTEFISCSVEQHANTVGQRWRGHPGP